jgi:hypothetical protein
MHTCAQQLQNYIAYAWLYASAAVELNSSDVRVITRRKLV